MQLTTLNLTIDGVQHNFLYRKGAVDEAVILHALVNTGYQFAPLRRAAELAGLYERLARSGKAPLIVDAGANIGASAVYFARKFAKARLVALEPDPDNCELLTANTKDLPVECLQAVVTAVAGTFNVVDRRGAAVGAMPAANPVAGVTVNDIYQRNAETTLPFIVKLDLDCSDDRLFAADTEWVARTPVIVIALHDSLLPGAANARAFVDYIADCNRDFVYLNDSIFSINRENAAPVTP